MAGIWFLPNSLDLNGHPEIIRLGCPIEQREAQAGWFWCRFSNRDIDGRPFWSSPRRGCPRCVNGLDGKIAVSQKNARPVQVPAMRHDLSRRTTAAAAGLRLRKRTAAHLVQLSEQREYLISRYAPDLVTSASQVNRLSATLDEIAKKAVPAVLPPVAAAA